MNFNSVKKISDSPYFNWAVFLFFFAVPFCIYGCLLIGGNLFVSGDGVAYFAFKMFSRDSMLEGAIPLWNPYLAGGMPYLAEIFVGVLYPIGVVLSILPSSFFVISYYGIHLAIGSFFTYLYLRELGCGKAAALTAALIYECSVHLGGFRKDHMTIISAVVWLPAIIYFIQRYANTKNLKYIFACSAAMAVQFLSGYVQIAFYTDVAAYFYMLAAVYGKGFTFGRVAKASLVLIIMYLGMAAVQLLPTAQLLAEYARFGATGVSEDFFRSYSIHFIKLLMMAVPFVFDNLYQPLGVANSSEMDIELFLGIPVLITLLFGIFAYFREKRIMIALGMMFFSFLYAANSHVPFLSDFLYHMPIFGSFRVPSRSLFIFIFFALVIFAVTLSKLENNSDADKFFRFSFCFSAAITFAAILLAVSVFKFLSYDEAVRYLRLNKEHFILIAFYSCVFTLCIYLVKRFAFREQYVMYRTGYFLICAAAFVLTVVQVSKYSFSSNISPASALSKTDANIPVDAGLNKIWVASPRQEYQESFIGFNKNAALGILSLNSYTAFNNPRMYKLFNGGRSVQFNYSGLFSFYSKAQEMLFFHNDLLSMLGVKYVLDPQGYLESDRDIYIPEKPGKILYQADSIVLEDYGSYALFQQEIDINPLTLYMISFEIDAETAPSLFYIDYYSGSGYDAEAQDLFFNIDFGKKEYHGYIFSGDKPADKDIYMRFISNQAEGFRITNFKLVEMVSRQVKNIYVPLSGALTYESDPVLEDYGDYHLFQTKIYPEESSDYIITFKADMENVPWLFVDFYGEGYDNPAQEIYFDTVGGQNVYSGTFNSGHIPAGKEIFARIVSGGGMPNISDFRIEKKNGSDKFPIYENKLAKDILFPSKYVKGITTAEDLYANPGDYDFSDTSYIEGISVDSVYNEDSVSIDGILFSNNGIKAEIVSEGGCFINFSQNYFPGWKGYVDGVNVPVHMVNGIIIGMEVPGGRHSIEFRFSPPIFYVGAVVSLLFVFFCIYFIIRNKARITDA